MHYVYALKSETHNFIYVGITDNLPRRVKQHNAGWNKSTKHYKSFRLIYYEVAPDKPSARKREKYWKNASGKRKLKSMTL
ncbi:MAG: GIY-YIG nuclease family protein [Bacteroidota bacterium]